MCVIGHAWNLRLLEVSSFDSLWLCGIVVMYVPGPYSRWLEILREDGRCLPWFPALVDLVESRSLVELSLTLSVFWSETMADTGLELARKSNVIGRTKVSEWPTTPQKMISLENPSCWSNHDSQRPNRILIFKEDFITSSNCINHGWKSPTCWAVDNRYLPNFLLLGSANFPSSQLYVASPSPCRSTPFFPTSLKRLKASELHKMTSLYGRE